MLMSARNKYKLKITEPALLDAEGISAYTFDHWGEQHAETYMREIDRAVQAIADDPDLGRERYGVARAIKGRKSGSHIIFYRVQDQIIYIMRILHESMDHGRHVDHQ
jgi:toxin ParE1/3/4